MTGAGASAHPEVCTREADRSLATNGVEVHDVVMRRCMVATALLLTACGGAVEAADEGPDAAVDANAPIDAGVTAPMEGASPLPSCALGAGAVPIDAPLGDATAYGSFGFTDQLLVPGSETSGSFVGGFVAMPAPPVDPACVVDLSASCMLAMRRCPSSPTTLGPSLNAGAVEIRGPAFGAVTVDIDATGGYGYGPPANAAGSNALFAAGDTLCLTARGGPLAFPPLPIVAPSLPSLTAPAWAVGSTSYSSPPHVATNADLVLSWVPGAAGERVSVALIGMLDGAGVECDFDATVGTGTIPQAGLGALSGESEGEVIVVGYRRALYAVGSMQVSVQAVSQTSSGLPVAWQ